MSKGKKKEPAEQPAEQAEKKEATGQLSKVERKDGPKKLKPKLDRPTIAPDLGVQLGDNKETMKYVCDCETESIQVEKGDCVNCGRDDVEWSEIAEPFDVPKNPNLGMG